MTAGDEEDFSRHLQGVRPLPPDRRVAPPRPRPRPAPRGPAPASAPERGLQVEVDGERHSGRAADVSHELVRRLAAGDPEPELRIDLHGRRAAAAQGQLERTLLDAARRGLRCVAVVHGRGRHSGGEPVLRSAVREWLQAPPLATRVAAFATAPPRLGGTGTTLVRLRRAAR